MALSIITNLSVSTPLSQSNESYVDGINNLYLLCIARQRLLGDMLRHTAANIFDPFHISHYFPV